MKVLVVGGTGFLGGAIAAEAVRAGHDVTILSRGKAPSKLVGARHIIAERNGPIDDLAGLKFDIVADTCAFGPEPVRHLLETLKGRIGCYAFISSINAYPDVSVPLVNEDAPTGRAPPEVLEHLKNLSPEEKGKQANYEEHYGVLKVEAERVALELLPDRAMILRAGILVGACDPHDRFGWWVRRIDQGGDMAVPGPPEKPVQFIDVRDIADFILAGNPGVFNMTGRAMPFIGMLNGIKCAIGSDARFHHVSDEAIAALGIKGWTGLPLWLPASEKDFAHILNVDVSKAFASGLKTRPIEETAKWVLEWDRSRRDVPLKTGIALEVEKRLLATQTHN